MNRKTPLLSIIFLAILALISPHHTLAFLAPDILSEYLGMSNYINGEITAPHCIPYGTRQKDSCQFGGAIFYTPAATTSVASVQFVFNQLNSDVSDIVARIQDASSRAVIATSTPLAVSAYPYQVQEGKNIVFTFSNQPPLTIGHRYFISTYWHDFQDHSLILFAPYNALAQSIALHVLRGALPATSTPISLSNPTETEDDGNQDGKGVADKTVFTFSVNVDGTPNSVNLVAVSETGTTTIPLTQSSPVYTATSTFPKGHYTYHFEATNGADIVKTGDQVFTTGYSNVAFLPGLEASRLYDETGTQLWEPNFQSHDNSQLYMNPSGNPAHPGIYVGRIIDSAYPATLSKGNVYLSFINKMNEMRDTGMIKNWQQFPYDWRYSVDDVVNNPIVVSGGTYSMTEALRLLAADSDTGKVTIIGHSNGGLIAKELSLKLGDDAPKLLDQMIFVASPQAGTPSAVGAILHGFQQGLPFDWYSPIINPQESRTLAKNMPSAYGLLPSANYFTYTDDPVIMFATTSPLLAPWVAKYGDVVHSGERLRNFLTDQTRTTLPTNNDLNNPNIGNLGLFDKEATLHSVLDTWAPPQGVQLSEIAGWGEQTLKTIEYKQGIDTRCADVIQTSTCSHYETVPILYFDPKMTVDGDGTVVTSSALWTATSTGAGKYWVDLDDYNNTRPQSLAHFNRTHANILEVPKLLDFMKDIIIRDNSTLPQYILTSAPQGNENDVRLAFTLHSPLTLDFYDDQGNHTGISTTTNEVEENIPGSRYMTFGDVKYISVPNSSGLHLSMKGYATGSFTLGMEQTEGDTTVAKTIFAGIPSSTTTVATMDIPANGTIANSSPLSVDENDDGTPEFTLVPNLDGIVTPDLTPPHTAASTTGTLGTNGWYTSNVILKLSATDTESGVKNTFYSTTTIPLWKTYSTTSPIIISTEGTTTLQFYSVDNAGNNEATSTLVIKIDKTSPSIAVSSPIQNHEYIVGETLVSNVTATDEISGVATITPNVTLDTGSLGAKNFTATATDKAGNTSTINIPYSVSLSQYVYSGILSPVNADGTSIFKLGSSVPFKFTLKNSAGQYVSTAVAKVSLAKITNSILGNETEAVSTSSATDGNLFRYSDPQYIFNLGTKTLSVGTWQVKIALDDGSMKYVNISLR